MLRKWCSDHAQAGYAPSVCHESQPDRALRRNTSSGNAQKTLLPEIRNSGCTTPSQCVPTSDLQTKSKLRPSQAGLRPLTHLQPPTANFERFFCGTHSTALAPACHPFVFDINIRVLDTFSGRLRKVMKRVLLDTGSDLNLISAPAHADLRTDIRPQKHRVRSIGGQSAVVGETKLDWTFIRSRSAKEINNCVFSDSFFVLSKEETPLFDCILGRHWIQGHRLVFLDLWAG